MGKTIIYLRTSTEEQNPDNQLEDCKKLLGGNEEVEVYREQQSAWKDDKDRPEFEKIKKEIKNKKVKQLIVWNLDRLYRNRKKQVAFMTFCKNYGVLIRSYNQKFLENIKQAPEPWDEIIYDMLIQIFGYMAEEESNIKSRRVRNAIKKREGKTYSYKGNKWGRKSVFTEKVINKVLKLRKEGYSIREISERVKYYDSNRNERKISRGSVSEILNKYT